MESAKRSEMIGGTATNCGSTGHRKTCIDGYKSIHLWPVVDPQFVAVVRCTYEYQSFTPVK
jgi:hypothetical protein